VPSEEAIIADSSPLIGLAKIGQLALLPQLARRVIVPPAVLDEVVDPAISAPGAREIARSRWMEIITPDPAAVAPLLILLGAGEAEAMALAQRETSAVLLLDDLRARKIAARLNLRRMGTVALLGRAKREGLVDKLQPLLELLVNSGIYIRQELVDAALKEAGE
jgi:predicted nucleic acid-binding protein